MGSEPSVSPTDINALDEVSLIRSLRLWNFDSIFSTPIEATNYARSAREIAVSHGYVRGEAYACLLKAVAESHQGQFTSSMELLDDAEILLQGHSDLWASLVIALHRKRGRVRLGIEGFEIGDILVHLESARELGDEPLIWQFLNTLSNLAEMDSKHTDAITWMSEALEHALSSNLRFETLASKMRLATYHGRLGMTTDAWKLEEEILNELAIPPRLEHLECLVWLSRGATEETLGHYERAIASFDAAERLALKFDDWSASGYAAFTSGRLALSLNDAASARSHFDAADDFWSRAGKPTHFGLDVLMQWYRDLTESIWSTKTAVQLQALLQHRDRLHRDVLILLLPALAKSMRALGDFEASFAYMLDELETRERFWRHSANHVAHLAAQAYNVGDARRRAEHEANRRAELDRAMQEVLKLHGENERLIEELRAKSAALEQLAWQDDLTRVGNRRWFTERMDEEAIRCAAFRHPLSVGFIDIDNFKYINDQYSHETGDRVLEEVAQVIQRGIRETDLLARFGGDEFATLLPEADENEALSILERVRQAIASHHWPGVSPSLSVSASIGVCTAPAGHESRELLHRADLSMYAAKLQGKNRVERISFTPETGSSGTASRQ